MVVLLTCKNEDPIKINALESLQHFSNCKSNGMFPYAQEQLTPHFHAVRGWIGSYFEVNLDDIAVRITCKNEEDPFKNEYNSVLTTFLPL